MRGPQDTCQNPTTTPTPPAHRQVLVVEDDAVVNRSIKTALERAGHRTATALTCSEGFSLAMTELPGLLILDLNLPDGSGWTLLKQIRCAYSCQAMPVVIVSSDSVTRSQLREARVHSWVPKPLNMPLLVCTANELLTGSTQTHHPAQ